MSVLNNYSDHSLSLLVIVVSGQFDGQRLVEMDQAELGSVMCCIRAHPTPRSIKSSPSSVPRWTIGELKGTQASIMIDSNVQLRFYKPWSLPFALKTKVKAELDRLQTEGIVTPVQFSSYAAPIVPIVKSDGNIRICGDYKLMVKQAARVDKYPLPKAEELFVSLAGPSSVNLI